VGEKQSQAFRLSFSAALEVDFTGSRVISDGGLILVSELDEGPRKGSLPDVHLNDTRQGSNKQSPLVDLLRQSICSRPAGCEDLNDGERVSCDLASRLMSSRKIWDRGADLSWTASYWTWTRTRAPCVYSGNAAPATGIPGPCVTARYSCSMISGLPGSEAADGGREHRQGPARSSVAGDRFSTVDRQGDRLSGMRRLCQPGGLRGPGRAWRIIAPFYSLFLRHQQGVCISLPESARFGTGSKELPRKEAVR